MHRLARWFVPLGFVAAFGAFVAFHAAPAAAQSAKQTGSAQSKATASRPSPADRATLEKKLEESLRNVVLTGSWQMADDKEKKLSPARTDRYTVESAHKADGDWWVIKARIQYEENDVTLPVRVRIVWAEDTPVITLDDLKLPGLGEYSARVMMFRGYYAGTWFAPGHGGVLSGQILPAE